VFKPAGSPTASRDAELYAPYRMPLKAPSITNSSTNSSSTRRYEPGAETNKQTERRLRVEAPYKNCVIVSPNSSQNKGLDWSRFGSARLCGDFDKIVCSHFAHADCKSVAWLMGVKCFSVPSVCREGEGGINI